MNSYLGKKEENYKSLSEEGKRENMVKKLKKLNKEFQIKMFENNEAISDDVRIIGNSINDFTKHLLNHYKSKYFHIKNENKKKKFLKDLKLLIGIYGQFENLFQHVYTSNNILRKSVVKPQSSSTPKSSSIPKPTQSTQNIIQNMHINGVEENLPNDTSTQCYKNSTLHLLLSIIKSELNTNGNKNVLFNDLFINTNNKNGSKENFKNLLKDMLLGKKIEYKRLLTTYFPKTMQPLNHQVWHDNNNYLNGILELESQIFSERLLKKIFNICVENIQINPSIVLNMNDYQINNNIDNNQIIRIIINLYKLQNLSMNNTLLYNNSLNYIIIQNPEIELKGGKNPSYGLRYNMNINLNSIVNTSYGNYIITDISYYNGNHYISVNKRGSNFYYFNDMSNRRILTPEEINNGSINGFLPKTILLQKVS